LGAERIAAAPLFAAADSSVSQYVAVPDVPVAALAERFFVVPAPVE